VALIPVCVNQPQRVVWSDSAHSQAVNPYERYPSDCDADPQRIKYGTEPVSDLTGRELEHSEDVH
jgi:hypothetical protein